MTVCITLAFLSGCMFHDNTPNFEFPEKFTLNNSSNPEVELTQNPWWENLGSVELNKLVLEGLENNKKISLAINRVERAQSSLDTIKLGWLPSLNFLIGRSSDNSDLYVGNVPVPTSSTAAFLAFIPAFMVNIFELPNKTKEASKRLEVSAADYLAVRTSISAQIVSAYATLLASREEERILSQMKLDLDTRVKTEKSMTSNGLSTQSDLNDINSNLQNLESQIIQNQANQSSAKNAVLILIGRSIGELNIKGQFSDLKIEQVTPGNTPVSVIDNRPDVAAARANIDAADYGISVAASSLAPTISFSYVTSNLDSTTNNQGGDGNANMSLAFALLSLDPQTIGKINTSNKKYDAALINYVEVVDKALRETDDALVKFETTNKKLKLEELSLVNTKTNDNTSEAMYKNGLVSMSKYLELKSKLNSSKISILQTKTQSVIAYSKLYQNMGGGASFNEKQFSIDKQSVKTTKSNNE